MTTDVLYSGASVLISIKATYQVRDESGLVTVEKTSGALVLTEKEIVFLEVKGVFKKERKRLHSFSVKNLVGYSYEQWGSGDVSFYLMYEDESGTRHNLIYSCSKKNYEKFIGKIKEHGFF
ncbi:MAG: hypothetical protein ACFE89_08670 [Candidatus Hodarchaeota archaeon]